ncbi:NfeD family protein [Roseofilum sp. BLCC_M91]|uniref:NfeD family protein n=1 Tax=Roseofilum halophilum BLCC-M91 TaxID=3022259 RepID=A0ABT7BK55_9CYAN|nr:NfeD family protein [Roseofilum halophilum]MDJ1178969.1 NfeD family protein [Roseofilum halophilum BLCC-M91]
MWFRNRKKSKSNSSCSMEWFQGERVVSQTIYPNRKGHVYFRGTWWPAKCCDNSTLEPDEIVEVIGNDNITLLVQAFKIES